MSRSGTLPTSSVIWLAERGNSRFARVSLVKRRPASRIVKPSSLSGFGLGSHWACKGVQASPTFARLNAFQEAGEPLSG